MGKVEHECERILEGLEDETGAKELMQYLKGTMNGTQICLPSICEEESPDEVNVYTDGSLKNPRGNRWRIGGFGIWWPRKAGEEPHEPDDDEYMFMHIEGDDKGGSHVECL